MSNEHLQTVHNIANVCAQKGIKRAVLSPGSRCAPLTIAFARHPEIETFVIPDERSAAFIALGMALKTGVPTVLICTSGTASLNYYPAIAEAFYQHIPLLILTADRPPELIDSGDGQCIRQEDVYKNHIKASYSFPISTIDNEYKVLQEAINLSFSKPMGPVHLNVPIREPFYPELNETLSFKNIELFNIQEPKATNPILPKSEYSNVLIVAGQESYSEEIISKLAALELPVICDSISNLHALPNAINTHDLLLNKLTNQKTQQLKPDLLISLGNAFLSKSLKQFLRTHKPLKHINFSNNTISGDVFQSIDTKYALHDFRLLNTNGLTNKFISYWLEQHNSIIDHTNAYLSTADWTEFNTLYHIIKSLPDTCSIHVSNSMSIRYVNHLSYLLKPEQKIYCNRGTSGIDGSNSTAVGFSICSTKIANILITGDISFFYDRNAFWHKHMPNNLSVILMNNNGGGIFRMIDGPARQPEHLEFFETPQNLNAANTAKDFGFDYFSPSNLKELQKINERLNKPYKNSIIEVVTDTQKNTAYYKGFKILK